MVRFVCYYLLFWRLNARCCEGNPVHNKKPNEYALVFGRVFGDGLVTSHGHKWKMDRAAITPSFHFDALKGYAETMNKQCDIMVGILAKVPHGKVRTAFLQRAGRTDISCRFARMWAVSRPCVRSTSSWKRHWAWT